MRARRIKPEVIQARVDQAIDDLTLDELMLGPDWWDRAEEILDSIHAQSGITRPRIAAALAILSPVKTWQETVKITRLLASDRDTRPRHWFKTWTKASYAMYGRSIGTDFDPAKYVHGPKVEPFYWNLLGYGHPVTIDRHMIRTFYPTDSASLHRINVLTLAFQDQPLVHDTLFQPRDLQASVWLKTRKVQAWND